MVVPSGMAKKRAFSAPSLQSGEFRSYGMSIAPGFFTSVASKQPVSANSSMVRSPVVGFSVTAMMRPVA